ncbi:MAG: 2Fe-2S iron-sulfur cluster-binding protein [Miltoncostaeaceae bacterium]
MADYAPVDLSAGDQVEFELNGVRVSVPAGTLLVDAANAHGVEVPVFCYEPRLGPPVGACRMCLVEVEGMRGLQTACSTPVQPDMVVRTNSPVAKDAQDGVLELLLANHPLDCPVCDKGGECPLQDRTFRFGPGRSRFVEPKRHFPKPLDLSPRVALDRERCIACYRCVRFSQDVAEDGCLTMQERGALSEITTLTGEPYEGRFTGNIIDICPVGALTSIPYRFVSRPWDIDNTPSVCGGCAAGCNVELTVREGHIMRVTGRPDPNWEVEEGWICDRARWSYDADRAPSRLTAPVIREGERVQQPDLDAAVDAAALVLANTGRVGVLIGPDATVEEAFAATELAHTGLGGAPVQALTIDGAGLAPLRALPTAQLGDLDHAQTLLIVGGDPANQQPAVELRARKARRRGAHVITVGPRPHALESLGESHRSQPGALRAALEGLGDVGEGSLAICWDEADLAQEPDAAAVLARIGREREAISLEMGHGANAAGLRALGIPSTGLREQIAAGEIDCLLTVHADPTAAPGAAEWGWALGRVRHIVAVATHDDQVTERATVVLPAATHRETEGVMVAMNGRAQRLRAGATPPEGAAPGWELLIALGHRLGTPPPYRTAATAFAAASAAHAALGALTHDDLGTLGRPLPQTPVAGNGHVPDPVGFSGDGLPLVTVTRIFGERASHRSQALAEARTGADITLHPDEAARHGLPAGARVRLRTAHGECELPLVIDPDQPQGAALVATGVPDAGVERLLPADRTPVRVEITPA